MAYPSRKRKGLKTKKSVLIVCEGTHTEGGYFEKIRQLLRKPNVNVHVYGEGKSQMALLDAVDGRAKTKSKEITSAWVVFDKDNLAREEIEKTYKFATRRNVNIGFTNICFELWLLLHFESIKGGPLDKNQLYRKLERHLQTDNYEKSKGNWDLIEKVAVNFRTAVKHNKKLLKQQNDKFTNPFSNIHEIIEEIESL
ncbi:RloB family protein [Virgibacillus sp. CBA3643]|uniref:RloB family protein n=1 Tax=Virgibacillus sp. CBA3643 TaxID=2942278 RepID=UPI0035A3AF59